MKRPTPSTVADVASERSIALRIRGRGPDYYVGRRTEGDVSQGDYHLAARYLLLTCSEELRARGCDCDECSANLAHVTRLLLLIEENESRMPTAGGTHQ